MTIFEQKLCLFPEFWSSCFCRRIPMIGLGIQMMHFPFTNVPIGLASVEQQHRETTLHSKCISP